jgi:DNA-binding MarR family transcriptional regulator
MASVLGVTAGAVTQLVDTMEGQGLLRREPHPADARCRVLRLTAGAEAEIAAFEQDIVESMTPRFEALSEVELGSLADLLRRLSPQ